MMKILSLLGLALALAVTAGCGSDGPARVEESQYKTLPSGLKYAVLKPGTGQEAKPGLRVQVHYTGWVTDGDAHGTAFDSSRNKGETFSFVLGRGEVIDGWDQGIAGMKEGEQRQLVIPPALGYGESGAGGSIPPNSTLTFDVELVKVG